MKRIGIINRGEPAIRFLNALDALRREEADAPESVALYTDADADSVYVRSAEHAIRIGERRTAHHKPRTTNNRRRAAAEEQRAASNERRATRNQQ